MDVDGGDDDRAGAPPTGAPERLRLSVLRGVGWVEFARAPVNAFDEQMVRETVVALEQVERDPEARVVVLASALERYFSAGAELQAFDGIGRDGMRRWVQLVHRVVTTLRGLTKPVLAAIHGTAVGGGLEMTLHCDVRFAAADARLGQPEVNLNFIPPVGATQALARLLGRPAALRYLYDGALLDAAAALGIGLVDEVVEPGRLRATVQDYAEALAGRPPGALAAIRRAVTVGGALTFDEGLRLEADLAAELAGTPDFAEGVRAFLEKRPPRWTAA